MLVFMTGMKTGQEMKQVLDFTTTYESDIRKGNKASYQAQNS